MKFALVALLCLCLALHADCSAAGKRQHLVSLIVSQAETLQELASKLQLLETQQYETKQQQQVSQLQEQEAKQQQRESQLQQQESQLQQQESQLQEQEKQLQQQASQLQQQESLLQQQASQLQQQESQLQRQESLLQQQASQLQQQASQLQQLQDKVESMETGQKECRADLNAVLNSTHPKQVAFSARYKGQEWKNVGQNSTLKYDQVVTNVGNGYLPYTGLFTAPYAGVYAFFTSLRSSNDHQWIMLGIYKGNTRLVVVTADGKGDLWDRGTAFVTTHLSKGEQVYVRQNGGGTYLEAGAFTTFSGMLVSAD